MINWSSIVTGLTAGGYRTIDGTSYGYRNDIQVNESRGVNIVGNPTHFFSNNAFGANIRDGRTRNALRAFIYNALRAESDYTDAQAASWGTATADEVLFLKPTVTGVANLSPWPVHSGGTGSQNNSAGNSNRQLSFVAIRDRNGHIRAWRIKSGISGPAFNSFATSYDKLTEEQIRTEFGLPPGLTYADQTISIAQGGTGTLPAATGGTAPYTYALGTETFGADSTATAWASTWANAGSAQTLQGTGSQDNTTHLFNDAATNKLHLVYRVSSSSVRISEVNTSTGVLSNTISPSASSNWTGTCSTPSGQWWRMRSVGTRIALRAINKTTGAAIGTRDYQIGGTENTAIAAISNTQLIIVGYSAAAFRVDFKRLTLNAAGTDIASGGEEATVRLGATVGFGTRVQAAEVYNNKLYLTDNNGRTFAFDMEAGAQGAEVGAALSGASGLANAGGNFYAATRPASTTYQLHQLAATQRTGGTFSSTLPTGITFNATTRVISVARSVALGLQNLKLRIRDSATAVAERIRNITLTVTAAVTTPTAVAGTLSIANKTVNLSSSASGTTTLEAASGGTGTVSYTLAVNGGTSCTLSGRTLTIPAGQAAGTFRLAVTATWTSGSSTATTTAFFNLTINRTQAPARGTFSPSAKSFSTTSSGSGSVTIDAASGGTGTITYQLRRPHATGLSLSGRTLSIASNTPAGAHTVTIRAYWTTPEGRLYVQSSFTLTVSRSQAPAVGTFSVANKSLTLATGATGTFDLEAASGGTGTITYTLVSPPTGITLSGRTVSVGSAVAAATISLTARATWTTVEGSRNIDRTFSLVLTRTVATPLAYSNQERSIDQGASGTAFPVATGGTPPYTYTLGQDSSSTPATTWAARWVQQGTRHAQALDNNTDGHLFYDAREEQLHAFFSIRTGNTAIRGTRVYDVDTATGAVSNPVTLDRLFNGIASTPDGSWFGFVQTSTPSQCTIYSIDKVAGTSSPLVVLDLSTIESMAAKSNTELLLLTRRSGALETRVFTLNAARTSGSLTSEITAGTFIRPGDALAGAEYYNGRVYATDGTQLYSMTLTQGEHLIRVGAHNAGTRGLAIAGRDFYSLILHTREISLWKLAATNGTDPTFSTTLPTGITFNATTRVMSVATTVAAGYQQLRLRVQDSASAQAIARVNLDVTVPVDTVPDAEAGTFVVSNKTLALSSTGSGSVQIEAGSGGVGSITYALTQGATGVTLSGNTLSVASTATAGVKNLTVRATWTSGTTTATADSSFTLTVTRTQAPVAGSFTVANKTLNLTSSGTGSVTMEQATGGTGTVSYTLRSAPAGISITGRAITVASSVTAGAKNITARATWTTPEGSRFVDASFVLTVNRTQAPVAGTLSISNKTINLSSSGTGTLTIEAASGGVGTVSYAIAVLGGTSLTLVGRTLTVPSGQIAGLFRLAITATWTTPEGTRTASSFFNVTINRTQRPVAGTLNVTDKTLALSSTGTGSVTIESASGGTGTVTYSLLSPPSGITISGRVISVGSAVTAGVKSLTARATWTTVEGSRTADSTFNLTVTRTQAPVAGTFTPGNLEADLDLTSAGTITVPEATGGTGTITYALTGNGGTSVTLSGRTLTIPAGQAAGLFRISLRARWTTVEGSRDVTVFVNLTIKRTEVLPDAATGTFNNQSQNVSGTSSQVFNRRFTAASGGTGTISYSLRTPPAGVTLSGTTLTLAASITGTVRITVRATWTSGTTTAHLDRVITITITRTQAPTTGAFTINNQTLRLGDNVQGTYQFPAAIGGTGTVTYSLLSPPTGITLSGRTITVAASVPEQAISLTVRATWTTVEGSVFLDATFTLTVDRPTPRAATGTFVLTNQTLATARSDETVKHTFASATGGTGTITYTLQDPPEGVTLTGRELTVAPPNVGSVSITVRATWTSGTTTAFLDRTFILTIPRTRAPETGNLSIPNAQLQLLTNGAGAHLVPAATGGVGTVSYSLVSPPAGITILVRTINVTGIVEAESYDLTVRATWTTVEGSRHLDTVFTLRITRSDTPIEPTPTGFVVPDRALIKCILDPKIRTGKGNSYKVYVNGTYIGVGNDRRN